MTALVFGGCSFSRSIRFLHVLSQTNLTSQSSRPLTRRLIDALGRMARPDPALTEEAEIELLSVAEDVAARLGEIEGVAAVVLGGSHARGSAEEGSDMDLGIYYFPSRLPSFERLRQLGRELHSGDSPSQVFDFGEWGPWENGGAWLRIQDIEVDWIYRDLEQVSNAIKECTRGIVSRHYEPSQPHGFKNYIYLGEIHYCRPLFDPAGVLGELKERIRIYPPSLKRAIVADFLFEAGFMLELAEPAADRGDAFYVCGCLFRCGAALVQVLYALNETYFMNEKGAVRAADSFALRPSEFSARITSILAALGHDSDSLRANLGGMAALVSEVRDLAKGVA